MFRALSARASCRFRGRNHATVSLVAATSCGWLLDAVIRAERGYGASFFGRLGLGSWTAGAACARRPH